MGLFERQSEFQTALTVLEQVMYRQATVGTMIDRRKHPNDSS
jgi:hypothetical protein